MLCEFETNAYLFRRVLLICNLLLPTVTCASSPLSFSQGGGTFDLGITEANITSPLPPPTDTITVFALVWSDTGALKVTALDALGVTIQ
jgi:hypothetical protein